MTRAPQYALPGLDRTQCDRRLLLGYRQRPDSVDDDSGSRRRQQGTGIAPGIHRVWKDFPDRDSNRCLFSHATSRRRGQFNRCSSEGPLDGGIRPLVVSSLIRQSSSARRCPRPIAPWVRAIAAAPSSPAGGLGRPDLRRFRRRRFGCDDRFRRFLGTFLLIWRARLRHHRNYRFDVIGRFGGLLRRRLILRDVEDINEFALPLEEFALALLVLENLSGEGGQLCEVCPAPHEFVPAPRRLFVDGTRGVFK